MVAGIHASIAARAADELEEQGKKRITPYWRTLKSGGELNPKYPGGLENLRARLARLGEQLREHANQKRASEHIEARGEASEAWMHLVHDPQTSGPLLIALPAAAADDAVGALQVAGYAQARKVGRVGDQSSKSLILK